MPIMKKWGMAHTLNFFLMSVADTQILSSPLLTSTESKVFVSVEIYMVRTSLYPTFSASF